MENKKLVERIQKLLSLATSGNQNEAEIASKKAHELLLKHNISMAEVEKAGLEFIEKVTDLPKRQTPERKYVHSLLINYFFVRIIQDKRRDRLVILGKEENVQTALYVRSFLINAFKRAYKEENKKQGWKGTNRNVFYYGMWEGLREKLESQKIKQCQDQNSEKALIVVDKALERFMKDQFKGLRNHSYSVNTENKEAKQAGHEVGKRLHIARGMESGSKQTQAAIGGSQ